MVFSEIYLQHIENTKIVDILLKHHIIGYFLYVDDILIVYKQDTTNIYGVLNIFNNIILSMKFTIDEGKENKINFLYITISKDVNDISFDFYRKPATTHTIIPNDFFHPQERKLAAIRYLANRMEIYNLSATNKEKENNTIKQILYNNKYDTSLLNKFTKIENKV
jgi:hypothetical protein